MKIGNNTRIYDTAKIVEGGRSWKAQITIGDDCLIGDYSFVAVKELVMEEGAQISPHAVISGGGYLHMKRYSNIGFGVQVITGSDTTHSKYMSEAAPPDLRNVVRGSVILGEGAYIGANAVICVSRKCPDIHIGDFSVVGSLSYLDESLPSYTIAYPEKRMVYKKRELI